jgi:hypothetical protein
MPAVLKRRAPTPPPPPTYDEYAGKSGVYIAIVSGFVKVGYTTNLPQRLRGIGHSAARKLRDADPKRTDVPAALPVHLVEFTALPTPELAFAAEQVVHARHADRAVRVNGVVSESYHLVDLPRLLAAVRVAVAAVTQ